MPIDASDRTLGLINIWQVFRKFCWEVELLKAIPKTLRVGMKPVDVLHVQDARIYAAINAASTSNALVDWLYHSIREDSHLLARAKDVLAGVCTDSEDKFRSSIRAMNKPINACNQICNANKHFHLGKKEKEFKVMVAELVMEHDDGATDISLVTHIVQNGGGSGGTGSVDDMLSGLTEWWEATLSSIQLPRREEFFPQ